MLALWRGEDVGSGRIDGRAGPRSKHQGVVSDCRQEEWYNGLTTAHKRSEAWQTLPGASIGRRVKARPYDAAPRLPEGDSIDLRALVRGDWMELEVGPGRGWFLVERAAAEPKAALVGLEVRRKWASIVDERLAKRGLGATARVFAEDAGIALPRIHPDASVRRVFVHFPDPWWKKRHRKRLVVKEGFVAEVARLLERGGELYVQTDVEERAVEIEALVAEESRLVPAGDTNDGPRMADNPYEARSPRERRAIADGLPVHRLRWRRSDA